MFFRCRYLNVFVFEPQISWTTTNLVWKLVILTQLRAHSHSYTPIYRVTRHLKVSFFLFTYSRFLESIPTIQRYVRRFWTKPGRSFEHEWFAGDTHNSWQLTFHYAWWSGNHVNHLGLLCVCFTVESIKLCVTNYCKEFSFS